TGAESQVYTRVLTNASYIKISNASLGYTLPKSFIDKFKLRDVRIYIRMYNLWIHEHAPYLFNVEGQSYQTASPLNSGGGSYGSYPLSRKIMFGLNVTF